MKINENQDSVNGLPNIMADIKVNARGIENLLSHHNPHKATGPDQIKPIILKNLSSALSLIIQQLFPKVPRFWSLTICMEGCQCGTCLQKGKPIKSSKLLTNILNLYSNM
jgi:hypothetical protein